MLGHARTAAFGLIAATVLAGAACSSREAGNPTAQPTSNEPAATATATVASPSPVPTTPSNGGTEELTTEELVQLATRSVVRVSTPNGVGSGFIIDPAGYIMTNNHVIETAPQAVEVALSDGSEYSATVVGRDPLSDLAVLKIESGQELPALPLANPDRVNVGEDVLAIGFALDLSGGSGPPSVTRGIVSATNRAIPTSGILGAVQTDAAINHGNSGGPLVNYAGEVVGVNTSLAPDTNTGGLAQNIGFAIGSDTIKAVYDEIRDRGFVDRALLGVGGLGPESGFAAIRPAEARTLGLPEDTKGVLIAPNGIAPGGPADVAGISGNDVVVKIGDYTIEDETDLAVAMVIYNPGDTVDVQFYHNGQLMTAQVTLGTNDGQ